MAAGVPVISTNSGGLPEVIEHGKSGYLSKIGDTDDMAKNAIQILSSKETHQQFKNQAQKRAKTFDIEVILPKYEDLYEKAINLSK